MNTDRTPKWERPNLPEHAQNLKIPYFRAGEFPDRNAARDHDRLIYAFNPGLPAFLRQCSPNELGPGQYSKICRPYEQLFMLVVQVYPGHRISALFKFPKSHLVEMCRRSLEEDPKIAQFIRDVKGGQYANN